MNFMETIYTNIYDGSSQFSMMVASFLAPSDYRSKAQKFFGENASLTVLREGGGGWPPIITTVCVSVYSIVSRGKELELKISKLYPEVRGLSDNCSVINPANFGRRAVAGASGAGAPFQQTSARCRGGSVWGRISWGAYLILICLLTYLNLYIWWFPCLLALLICLLAFSPWDYSDRSTCFKGICLQKQILFQFFLAQSCVGCLGKDMQMLLWPAVILQIFAQAHRTLSSQDWSSQCPGVLGENWGRKANTCKFPHC